MPTADNFWFGDCLNEDEYDAASTPLPTDSTVSNHGTAANQLNLNPSAQAHQDGRSNSGMFQAHFASRFLFGPTASDHGKMCAYYNQVLQARAQYRPAISKPYVHEGHYAPAGTCGSTTIDGSIPDTSLYTGSPPHVRQETTSARYNGQTAPAFTVGSTNNSLWVADNSHYTSHPAQADDKVISTQKRRYGCDKSPQPAQQVATVSVVTDSESQSPRDNSRVPELTKFEKWLVCFFTLHGIKDLANINLQILRYRALHSQDDVTRCNFKSRINSIKWDSSGNASYKSYSGCLSDGKTATSLHTVREEARTRDRYLQQLLSSIWDRTITAERINVDYVFLDYLLYRARAHSLIIAATVARQEQIAFTRQRYDMKYFVWDKKKRHPQKIINAGFVSGHERAKMVWQGRN